MRSRALLALSSTFFAGLCSIGCIAPDTQESADEESGAGGDDSAEVGGADDGGSTIDLDAAPGHAPHGLPDWIGTNAIEPPLNDQCGGELISLGLSATTTITRQGSTTNATDDYDSWCGDTSRATEGRDVVYRLWLAETSILDLRVVPVGSPWAPAMTIRRGDALGTCSVADDEWDYCAAWSVFAGDLPDQAFEAGEYFVIVDADDESFGDFEITASITAPGCGDGVVSGSEECDAGITDPEGAPVNGCTATCTFEGAQVATDTCAGAGLLEAANITAGESLRIEGHTTGQNDDYLGSCSWDLGGPDSVYRVHVGGSGSGMMTITVGNAAVDTPACDDLDSSLCWDRVLYVRTGDCEEGVEIGCSDSDDWAAMSQLTFAASAGDDFYVFVDGYDDWSWGPFFLDVTLSDGE